MFSQHKTDSVTRSVASLTLDGRKLTAEVTILLHRAMGRSDAEALATQIAGIVDEILSAQIVQGQTPLTTTELEALTLAKAKGLGKVARVRITSLRLSVAPTGHVPSVRPPPTKPPEHRAGASHDSGTRPCPVRPENSPVVRSHDKTPSGTLQKPSPLPSTPPLRARTSAPPQSMPSRPPAGPATAPPPPPSPASEAPNRAPSRPQESASVNVDAFGAALALPLRDAAARTVLSMLSVVTKPKIDRLSFLEGQPPAQEIRREVCACFAASIYGECIARGEPHKLAAAKVESVCQRAFPDESAPTATEIGFYIAIAVPVDELAGRVATLLGCEQDLPLLRAAVGSCRSTFGERVALSHERIR